MRVDFLISKGTFFDVIAYYENLYTRTQSCSPIIILLSISEKKIFKWELAACLGKEL